jgi:hypothetical protein
VLKSSVGNGHGREVTPRGMATRDGMKTDDCESENIVVQDSEDGGGNTGARMAGSGGRRMMMMNLFRPALST